MLAKLRFMDINYFYTVGKYCGMACQVGFLLTPFCEQTLMDSLLNDTVVVLVNI